jgi:MrfA Zn-binding domain
MPDRYGKIGRSQIVSTYGVGSIYELRTSFQGHQTLDSVMIAGLDEWNYFVDKGKYPKIREQQLEKSLGVSFFVGAPRAEDEGPGRKPAYNQPYIPAVRFPKWMYCSNSDCGRLGRVPKEFDDQHGSPKCKKNNCTGHGIPVRLVTSCYAAGDQESNNGHPGHIDDFPWEWWAHKGDNQKECKKPELYMISSGKSAGLAGLRVECRSKECQKAHGLTGNKYVGNTLAEVFNPEKFAARKCWGNRPWLKDQEGCQRPVRVLMRGASNVYFPVVASALSIPPYSDALVQQLNHPAGQMLRDNYTSFPIETLVTMVKNAVPGASDYPDESIADAIRVFVGEHEGLKKLTESEQRALERQAFIQPSSDYHPGSEFHIDKCNLELTPSLREVVNDLVKAFKLREVRALRGFHRVESTPVSDSFSASCAPLSKEISHWLPAIEVRGEGIYIELREDLVSKWKRRSDVLKRYALLVRNFESYLNRTGIKDEMPPVEKVMIHTLAHLLINQLSLDCGYSSASLRERLFVSTEDSFCGVLIYTATAGADGTLGGLTRQGDPVIFQKTLSAALQTARWCASDPLCMESKGQGSEALNLAACHACCLVSETSCESRNLFLDRALVIGHPETPETGFFHNTDIINGA